MRFQCKLFRRSDLEREEQSSCRDVSCIATASDIAQHRLMKRHFFTHSRKAAAVCGLLFLSAPHLLKLPVEAALLTEGRPGLLLTRVTRLSSRLTYFSFVVGPTCSMENLLEVLSQPVASSCCS